MIIWIGINAIVKKKFIFYPENIGRKEWRKMYNEDYPHISGTSAILLGTLCVILGLILLIESIWVTFY